LLHAAALRYALGPACILLAVLLYLSPAKPFLSLAGLCALAVIATAWLGGPGPGLVAAVIATIALPRLAAVGYPLVGGFLDMPRFITFSIVGLAVGWWGLRRRQVDATLRESEKRYALAMEAAGDGHTDWDLVSGEFYISPRLLEIVGHSPDATFADRADWVRRFPFHPEDRPKWERAVAAHFAGRQSHFKMELRIVVAGEVRWTAFHFLSTRNASGAPIPLDRVDRRHHRAEARRGGTARQRGTTKPRDGSCRLGLCRLRRRHRAVVSSERLNEIFGFPRDARFANRSDFPGARSLLRRRREDLR
jgi:PAS domain-containing protein